MRDLKKLILKFASDQSGLSTSTIKRFSAAALHPLRPRGR